MNAKKMPLTLSTSQRTRENRLQRLAKERVSANLAAADNANQTLEQTVRSQLHGVTNPLNLLLNSNLTPAQRVWAQDARDSAMQLAALLREGKAWAQQSADAPRQDSPCFDLFEQLEQTYLIRSAAAATQGVSLTRSFSGLAHAMVQADAAAVARMFSNVIDAALAPDRHTSLQVEIDLQHAGSQQYRLCVRVFGTDARRSEVGSEASSGNVRLALAQRMVAADGGHMGVEKVSAEVDRYWFLLVLDSAPSRLKALRIMFVEPDADRRSDRKAELRACGLHVEAFDNTAVALKALARAAESHNPYRVLILDQEQEGLSGEAISGIGQIIRSNPLYGTVRLLLLSAAENSPQYQPMSAAQLTDAGFSGWLQRPFLPQSLLSTIARLSAPQAEYSDLALITNVATSPGSQTGQLSQSGEASLPG